MPTVHENIQETQRLLRKANELLQKLPEADGQRSRVIAANVANINRLDYLAAELQTLTSESRCRSEV